MISTADRINTVEEYYFSKKLREIASLVAAGEPIINLGIGSPDLKPSENVIDELENVAHLPGAHGYQSYRGLTELREAFSNWYEKYYALRPDPNTEVLPLIGSKEGILHISMTYLQPGDQVLVPDPGYPAYAAAAKLAGAEVITYNLNEANDYQPKLDELEKGDLSRVKIMWVNYPNMPTGAKAGAQLFDRLIKFAKNNQLLVVNDNPYSFILNDNPESIFNNRISEHCLELNSLSKSHNMAGWRIGVLIGTEHHINNILKFKSNMDSGMFLPVQKAAVKALSLEDDWYTTLNNIYKKRQNLGFQLLDSLQCSYSSTQAGMFVWGKAPDHVGDVNQWINQLLEKKKIFITPGFIFGKNGQRYLRISLCSSEEKLKEALERIKVKSI